MPKFIKKPPNFLNFTSLSYLAAASGFIMLFTKLSGILKLQILTYIYGIRSTELSLFHAANTIPEFIFLIIAVGSLNAAIIPVLTEVKIKEEKKENFNKVFSTLVNFFMLIMTGISLIIIIFANQIAGAIINSNISQIPTTLGKNEIDTFTNLLRILMISPIILAVSSILSCSLQIQKRFLITQLSPLFYNLGLIATGLFILPIFDNNIYILSFGVLLGSLFHLLIQIPSAINVGIKYYIDSFNFRNFYVVKALKLTIPRTIGLSVDYIGNIFQMLIGLRILGDYFNAFKLANSLREMPNSIFGSAISQAYFPKMSELAKSKQLEELQETFSNCVRAILFWTIPVTSIFIVLRTPIVRLSFGIFDSDATFTDISLIAYTLLFLSLGIIFYSLLSIVNRIYFVLDDTKTTTYVSIFIIFIEVILMIALANVFSNVNNFSLNPLIFFQDYNNYFTNGDSLAAIGGIALASSTAAFLNLSLLIYFLKFKSISFFHKSYLIYIKIINGVIMTVVGFLVLKVIEDYFDEESLVATLILTINVFTSMVLVYLILCKLFKDTDLIILSKPTNNIKDYFSKIVKTLRSDKVKITPES